MRQRETISESVKTGSDPPEWTADDARDTFLLSDENSRMLKFPFKLITFDVNGTLLKPQGAIGKTYAEFGKRHGIIASPDLLEKRFRTVYKMMDQQHPNFGLSSGLGWRGWWMDLVKETFQCAPRGSGSSPYTSSEAVSENDHTKIEATAEDLIQHYSTGQAWAFEHRTVELLENLKLAGVDLGIISNTDPRLHSILKDKNVYEHFIFVLTAYEAQVAKPEVAIFKMAEELYSRAGARTDFDRQRALHVGNSFELDFVPAKLAGWHSVLVNNKKTSLPDNTLSFPSLIELNDYFVELRRS